METLKFYFLHSAWAFHKLFYPKNLLRGAIDAIYTDGGKCGKCRKRRRKMRGSVERVLRRSMKLLQKRCKQLKFHKMCISCKIKQANAEHTNLVQAKQEVQTNVGDKFDTRSARCVKMRQLWCVRRKDLKKLSTEILLWNGILHATKM